MSLTKASLIDSLMLELKLERSAADHFIDQFFREITSALESGIDVRISGFGNFVVSDKRPRLGRNPRSGEPALITARRVVTFQAGDKLRRRVAKD